MSSDRRTAAAKPSEVAPLGGRNPFVTRDKVMAVHVNWGTFSKMGDRFISDAEATVLEEYDGLDASGISEALETQANGEALASALMKVLNNVSDVDARRKAVTMLEDLLSPDPKGRVELFVTHEGGRSHLNAHSLLRVLNASPADAYVTHKAAACLALMFSVRPEVVAITDSFAQWIERELSVPVRDDPKAYPAAAVNAMMVFVRAPEMRELLTTPNVVGRLTVLLDSMARSPQALYEVTFCLWVLSFCRLAPVVFLEARTVYKLADQARTASKEKVVRVTLATLNNLAPTHGGVFAEAMVGHGMLRTLESLGSRTWADSDIPTEIDNLSRRLLDSVQHMTTMDRFEKQVLSGRLEWGPMHKEKFFREHAEKFEKNDFELVKCVGGATRLSRHNPFRASLLVELLESDDATTVAVACHDLGEFVRYYPAGKAVSRLMKLKPAVMQHLKHDDPSVRQQALAACSKLMLSNWEFMEGTSSPVVGDRE